MAEKHISRRKLICQVPTVVAAGVVMPAFGTELTNIAEQEWKDRLAIAAVKLRDLSVDTFCLLESAEESSTKSFSHISGYCDGAYRKKDDERADAEIDMFNIIFEGVKT